MELKLVDLLVSCQRCGGAGDVLERTGGSGGSFGMGPTVIAGPCPDCNGRGFQLTGLGHVLADFFGRLRSKGVI